MTVQRIKGERGLYNSNNDDDADDDDDDYDDDDNNKQTDILFQYLNSFHFVFFLGCIGS